jgi:hypothetical protein
LTVASRSCRRVMNLLRCTHLWLVSIHYMSIVFGGPFNFELRANIRRRSLQHTVMGLSLGDVAFARGRGRMNQDNQR